MKNITIKVKEKGIEHALKMYKNTFKKYKIKEELIENKEYTKKSVKKRKMKMKAIYVRNKFFNQ